jgi:hypothetical protein
MATVNLGRIKSVWRGTWATGTAYSRDDVVQEGVNSYICTQAHTAGATFAGDSANWDLMAQGADIPSQTGHSGKALVTDGNTLSWGSGGKLLQVKASSSTTKFSSSANLDSYYNNNSSSQGIQMLNVSMTRVSANSRIIVWGHSSGWAAGNQSSATGLYAGTTRLAMALSNGYAGDNWNGACNANVPSSLVGSGTVTYQYRLLGTRNGDTVQSYYYGSTNTDMNAFYTSLTVMEVEV